jgi:hypothetical protein
MLSKSFSDQKIAASVGAGLLAMAVCQATGMLDVPTSSPASRLLQRLRSGVSDEVQEPDRPITVFKTREEVTRQENQGIAPV